MPNELKPCPFCGGEARRYYGNYDMHGIVCKKCSAKVYGYANQAAATKAWSRRAGVEAEIAKLVAENERILKQAGFYEYISSKESER
jgi:Lar family restriction alleviation protein